MQLHAGHPPVSHRDQVGPWLVDRDSVSPPYPQVDEDQHPVARVEEAFRRYLLLFPHLSGPFQELADSAVTAKDSSFGVVAYLKRRPGRR